MTQMEMSHLMPCAWTRQAATKAVKTIKVVKLVMPLPQTAKRGHLARRPARFHTPLRQAHHNRNRSIHLTKKGPSFSLHFKRLGLHHGCP